MNILDLIVEYAEYGDVEKFEYQLQVRVQRQMCEN